MKMGNKRVFGVFRNQNIGLKHILEQRAPVHINTTRHVPNENYIVLLIYSEASRLFIAFKVLPLGRCEALQFDYLFICITYAVQNDVIA